MVKVRVVIQIRVNLELGQIRVNLGLDVTNH